jgi:quercetin dioxygenase-like cupin family protein
MMNKTIFALPLAMALGCVFAAAQEAGPSVLVKEIVAGMPKLDQQEIKVLAGTLQPGGKTPFHTHQYPVTVYVQEGTFTLELEGRPPLVKKAGEAFTEPPNVKMTGYNRSATEPAKVVIFYVSGPGEPFLHPAH